MPFGTRSPFRPRRSGTEVLTMGAIVVMVVLVLVSCIGSTVIQLLTQENVTAVVTEKERIVQRSGDSVSSKYLVFTEGEVFQNTDSLVFFKWNSSDVQGQLKVGHEYRLRVAGFRVPFFSWYRNIIEVHEDLGPADDD